MISRFQWFFHRMLHSPIQVLSLGLITIMLVLTFDGSLWKYWNLRRGQEDMKLRMADLEAKARQLDFQIHQAGSLTYIERQATDQFDYVREGDLIFIFSE